MEEAVLRFFRCIGRVQSWGDRHGLWHPPRPPSQESTALFLLQIHKLFFVLDFIPFGFGVAEFVWCFRVFYVFRFYNVLRNLEMTLWGDCNFKKYICCNPWILSVMGGGGLTECMFVTRNCSVYRELYSFLDVYVRWWSTNLGTPNNFSILGVGLLSLIWRWASWIIFHGGSHVYVRWGITTPIIPNNFSFVIWNGYVINQLVTWFACISRNLIKSITARSLYLAVLYALFFPFIFTFLLLLLDF